MTIKNFPAKTHYNAAVIKKGQNCSIPLTLHSAIFPTIAALFAPQSSPKKQPLHVAWRPAGQHRENAG
jgi:hypothetical protein